MAAQAEDTSLLPHTAEAGLTGGTGGIGVAGTGMAGIGTAGTGAATEAGTAIGGMITTDFRSDFIRTGIPDGVTTIMVIIHITEVIGMITRITPPVLIRPARTLTRLFKTGWLAEAIMTGRSTV
jgi:hypothetical protein